MTITTIDIVVESEPPGTPVTYSYIAYATIEQADRRLLVDPIRSGAWATLTTDQKSQSLVAATNRLDLLLWSGAKTGSEQDQPNAWPRTGMFYCDGSPAPVDEVPIDVETATILQAGSVSIDPTADTGSSTQTIKSAGAGSAKVEFFSGSTLAGPPKGSPIKDPTIHNLVRCFISIDAAIGGAVGAYAPGSGADAPKTCFGDTEPLGRSKGYA